MNQLFTYCDSINLFKIYYDSPVVRSQLELVYMIKSNLRKKYVAWAFTADDGHATKIIDLASGICYVGFDMTSLVRWLLWQKNLVHSTSMICSTLSYAFKTGMIFIANRFHLVVSSLNKLGSGLFLDEDLPFHKHVDQLVIPFISMIWRNDKYIPLKKRKQTYFACVQSKVQRHFSCNSGIQSCNLLSKVDTLCLQCLK